MGNSGSGGGGGSGALGVGGGLTAATPSAAATVDTLAGLIKAMNPKGSSIASLRAQFPGTRAEFDATILKGVEEGRFALQEIGQSRYAAPSPKVDATLRQHGFDPDNILRLPNPNREGGESRYHIISLRET